MQVAHWGVTVHPSSKRIKSAQSLTEGVAVATALPKEMKTKLAEFLAEGDEILKPFTAALIARPTPSVVYHYTDDKGLKGILESGCIRLSDMFRMNDPSELRHGFSHACKILSAKAKTGPPEAKRFAEKFAEEITAGMEEVAQFFICSFSTRGDELGQWRAYADNGRGYAVGFAGKKLESAFASDFDGNAFHITYNDKKLAAMHRRMVEGMFDWISRDCISRWWGRLDRTSMETHMKALAIALAQNVIEAALFFKHEGYKSEAEYRFRKVYDAKTKVPHLQRRYRASEVVKYLDFNWKRAGAGVLKEIVVGPAIDPSKGRRFVNDCRTAFGIGLVNVKVSGIPYRAV